MKITDPKSSYYDVGGITTQDVIEAKTTRVRDGYLGCLLGNILKYTCRLPYKGQRTRDAEKILMYATWLVDKCKSMDEEERQKELTR